MRFKSWHDPGMIYKASEVIQIFLADGRAGKRANEGVPRGPRGPKKRIRYPFLTPDESKLFVLGKTARFIDADSWAPGPDFSSPTF